MAATVIIGLGNPILGDDAVGIRVAGILKERLSGNSTVDVVTLYAGGIRLLDVLAGYEKSIIIDAMVTGLNTPGTVLRLTPGDIIQTSNSVSVHDMSLPAALELGRMIGVKLPGEITIFGIEAGDLQTFTESLTSMVETAIPEVVSSVLQICNLAA